LVAFLAQGYAHFSSGCGFMLGFGEPQLRAKFEVAGFSRCKNIKWEPTKFWEVSVVQDHVHFFFGVGFYDGPWQTQAVYKI